MKHTLFYFRSNKGALLLTFMVFVAIIGAGALFMIPPIEKQGRGVLERSYEDSLKNFYRAFHQYLESELPEEGKIAVSLKMPSVTGYDDKDAEMTLDQPDQIITDLIDNGFLTQRQVDQQLFPAVDSAMDWEVLLIPLY